MHPQVLRTLSQHVESVNLCGLSPAAFLSPFAVKACYIDILKR